MLHKKQLFTILETICTNKTEIALDYEVTQLKADLDRIVGGLTSMNTAGLTPTLIVDALALVTSDKAETLDTSLQTILGQR